jgi:hypothetical protein
MLEVGEARIVATAKESSMARTLPLPARFSLIVVLVLPLYGQDGCYENCAADYVLCDLNGANDGWCLGGSCVANACTGVNCDDANACTVDTCDPFVGTCSYAQSPGFFPACDPGGGAEGVCVDTVCKPAGNADPCLLPGIGRINCCDPLDFCGAFSPACLPTNYLDPGTPCDPTGVEPPDGQDQDGTCNANGVCVWNDDPEVDNPCEGVVCQDDSTECVIEWCDPATYAANGCETAQLQGAPTCSDSGACISGVCRSQNTCVTDEGFRNCCTGCNAGMLDCGEIVDLNCSPLGLNNPVVGDPTLGGICSFDAECIPLACAVPDPANSGFFVELNCDDGLPCTVDECDPSAGTGELGTGACVNTPLPDYTPCDGGQGICISGAYGANSWCVLNP